MSRKQCLEVLKRLLEAMEVFDGISPSPERINALKMAIASLETDEAYQLEYESTTKNDLGVDAVSRKAVHDMLENLPITVEDKWFNWLQKACMRLAELPSVTPQEPIKSVLKQIKIEMKNLKDHRYFCHHYECGINEYINVLNKHMESEG